ncbi:hypothetical protein PR048_031028 [Dryococelus australis]|uniref:Transposase n=1 Tax=Dryococelus australis TaxID=614101 RepID=A0ABQ9G455_9NEOP|nr:hypothetical protein PR048_031028 [Dryococelus australis]
MLEVKHLYEYETTAGRIGEPHIQAQVIMARGLLPSWNQPVYIDFDRKNDSSELYESGFRVVACVGDRGGGNFALWKELVDSVIQYQMHASFTIFLMGHIFSNSLQPRFLDNGFFWPNENVANKNPVTALYQGISFSEVRSCHKLSTRHVEHGKTQRQNVRLATELLCHTTSTAMADFIDLINSWFDLMNSYGVTISANSIKQLFTDLQMEYPSIKYILTYRLKQYCLENLFGQIRTRGGLNDHSSPIDALNRLRIIILGKSPGIVQNEVNTIDAAAWSERIHCLQCFLRCWYCWRHLRAT